MPSIVSEPVVRARVGREYVYALSLQEADGLSLLEGPAGMTLDENGTLRWVPASAGTATVRVSATNGTATTEQSWTIAVEPAVMPSIVSEPAVHARVGREYVYALSLEGTDGLLLAFAVAEGPAGASVDATGVLRWIPESGGDADVEVMVDYGVGTLTQRWRVDVHAAEDALAASLVITPGGDPSGRHRHGDDRRHRCRRQSDCRRAARRLAACYRRRRTGDPHRARGGG